MTKRPVQARRLAPAKFLGIQDGFGLIPSVELYNLSARVGIHPVGSSVSRSTLESHGYYVPPLPVEEFVYS